jgi:alpha,alpha-trehalose-phosphate synthase [UDP-forming]
MSRIDSRLIMVSNRLPVTFSGTGEGRHVEVSSGGLVAALSPLLSTHGGCWIGWTGSDPEEHDVDLLQEFSDQRGFAIRPVSLTASEEAHFYRGFCNEILWPLFHDLQSRCNFDPDYWDWYLAVNEKFALSVESAMTGNDFVWVHDYHLMLLATCLRDRPGRPKLAYFHHIPFPAPDIFAKLPWRTEILRSLLQFNVLGFQTNRDRRNFIACVRSLLRPVHIRQAGGQLLICASGYTTSVGTFPIGINASDLCAAAAQDSVIARAASIRNEIGTQHLVLGVDRLDYTKGIPERLKGFSRLLATHPELHRKIMLLQVVVPSREEIPKFQELKLEVERLVSEINGQYGGPEWVPVRYMHRRLERDELLAYYRAADVALVTPLKDGMNLVAKEFCAARLDDNGVLILSEFAGSADQLRVGAVLVNPYDAENVAKAIDFACRMPQSERAKRMTKMRSIVREEDVFQWCQAFCRRSPIQRAETHVMPAPVTTRAGIRVRVRSVASG